MAQVSLGALSGPDIPNLGGGVAGSRNEHVLVGGGDGKGHDITVVVPEGGDSLTLLDIPVDAGGVSGGGDDVALVDEAAAGQVTVVRSELLGCAHSLGGLELVDGAKVIQSSASNHVVDGGLEGAGHDPGGPKGDGLDLVCGHGVPDDELSILGSGHKLGGVASPVHSINLSEMSLKDAASAGHRAEDLGGSGS